MCGIYGTTNEKDFIDLYNLNKERGSFSVGNLFVGIDKFSIVKGKSFNIINDIPSGYKLYLGHTRAPTNTVTYFDYNEAHPFIYGDWCVGHNGIILNFQKLKKEYKIPNSVDSSCIPFL